MWHLGTWLVVDLAVLGSRIILVALSKLIDYVNQFNYWKHCPRQLCLLLRPCCKTKGAWRKGQACGSKDLLQGSVAIQTTLGHIWQKLKANTNMGEVLSNLGKQITGIIIREWNAWGSRGAGSHASAGKDWEAAIGSKMKKKVLMGDGRGGINTQVLWGRNCFEVEEIQSEWETQAEVPELTWCEGVAVDWETESGEGLQIGLRDSSNLCRTSFPNWSSWCRAMKTPYGGKVSFFCWGGGLRLGHVIKQSLQ